MIDFEVRPDKREGRIEFLTQSGYWDQSFWVRAVIGAAFILIYFSAIYFCDVRTENFELDSEASSYAVAQIDFAFHDKEATMMSQQEATRDIQWIYAIDTKNADELKRDFRRRLRENDSWRAVISQGGLDELTIAGNALFEACRQVRFTDNKTYLKLQKLGLDVDKIYVLEDINDHQAFRIPAKVWQSLAHLAFRDKNLPDDVKNLSLEYLEDELWRFDIDVAGGRHIREQVQAQVSPKIERIKAGYQIISQGEKVTERHLDMLRAMREALREKRQLTRAVPIVATLGLVSVMVITAAGFLKRYYPDIFFSNRRLFLIFCLQASVFALAELIERFVLNTLMGNFDVVDNILLTPFIALLGLTLLPSALVIFLCIITIVVMSAALPIEGPCFAFVNLVGAFVAMCAKAEGGLRRTVVMSGIKVFLATSLASLCLQMAMTGKFDLSVFNDIIFLAGMSALSSILTITLMPFIENAFKIMTEMSLMNYLDPSRELLRRLSIEAPGTYQHSLVVAHLAEVGATAIGARALFCRVSAFYHDIGKLAFPHYFVENQQGVNVHQLLTPIESAQVIIAHISEGVMMARKHGLPEPFIDIIKEHHGTSLVYYFWCKAKEGLKEGQVLSEKDFRYCGPKPRSKESVIIMLADCLEAGSRSIEELNEEKATQLMENIVRHELVDGQLDNSPLTLQELALVKRVLVKTLVAASHSRIKYPKRGSDGS